MQQNAAVRALLLLLGLVSVVGMPYAVLMPIFADRVLGGGAATMGILLGATGVGALAAALLLAVRTSARGLGRWIAGSAIGFGVALAAFSASRSVPLSTLVLVATGFFMMTQMAASNTLLQVLTPDALRGRIMAFYSMMFMGMAPFGALGAGAAATRLGAPLTVAIGGAVSVAAGLVFAWRLPSLRASRARAARGARGGGRRAARDGDTGRPAGARAAQASRRLGSAGASATCARGTARVLAVRGAPDPEAALEGARVAADPGLGRQLLQVLHVAATEHDLVDLEGVAQLRHDLGDELAPALLAQTVEAALAEEVLVALAVAVRQVRDLQGLHDAFQHERRAEAGAEAQEQHAPAAVAAERLHHRVVQDPHGPAKGAAVVEAGPAAADVLRLLQHPAVLHRARERRS